MKRLLAIAAIIAAPTCAPAFADRGECLDALAMATDLADANESALEFRLSRAEASPDAPNEDTEAYRDALDRMKQGAADARDALFAICGRY